MQFLVDESEFLMGVENRSPLMNTTYSNQTWQDEEIYVGPEWIVVPVLFGIIFLVGITGNGTLIYTVLRNKNMHSAPNVLLVSLAIGDLLLILISVPFSSTIYTFPSWPYGEVVCKLNEFLETLSLGVSVFTLIALSGERYMVIVHPMANHRGPSMFRTLVFAALIWIVSASLASIELFAAHVDQGEVFVCDIYPRGWGKWYERFHSMFQFVIYFGLPLIVIATFYALMARMLTHSSLPGDDIQGQIVKQVNRNFNQNILKQI